MNYYTANQKIKGYIRKTLVGSLVVFSFLLPLGLSGFVSGTPTARAQYVVSPPVQLTTQTFTWSSGFNIVGITMDKQGYKAANFLSDLNCSFVDVPPQPFVQGGGPGCYGPLAVIYKYNADRSSWEYYTSWGAGSNFSIVPGEGYFVRSYDKGLSSISGTAPGENIIYPVYIATGWSLVSLTENQGVSTAEAVLQKMKDNDIGATVLVKYDSQRGRYIMHYAGITELNNFAVNPGDGFWVYNSGNPGYLR